MIKDTLSTLDILQAYIVGTNRDNTLLDDWASEVVQNEDYGFENGLLGLGWLIGYLIQEKYINGNADEVLEDIDDMLYKLTIVEILCPETNITRLLHFVSYYQQRIQYPSKTHFFKQFTHIECMKLLLEKLNEYLLEDSLKLPEDISKQIHIVHKFSYLFKTCITEELVEEGFYVTMERLIVFFEDLERPQKYQEQIARLYIVARQYANPYWEVKLKAILERIMVDDGLKSVWISLAQCTSWQKEKFIQFVIDNKFDKQLLFELVTNIKDED